MNHLKQDINQRQQILLHQLKNRLFDISRRNRLLYYKPNNRFINLTHLSALSLIETNKEKLLFWNNDIEEKIRKGKDLVITEYFDLLLYPNTADLFNKIRLESNKNIHEYGFSSLRLVIAFLHWHNPHEDVSERISSPLVLIPVRFTKKKGIKEQYIIETLDTEAEVNPVLIHQFKKLFNISLPEKIQLEEETLQHFVGMIKQQIDLAASGVSIIIHEQPDFDELRTRAKELSVNFQDKKKAKISLKEPQLQKNILNKIKKQYPIIYFLNPEHRDLQRIQRNTLYYAKAKNRNKLIWEFDLCNMILGNFNYKKMSLVSDYNEIIENNIANPVFDLLFKDTVKTITNTDDSLIAFNELYNVVTSDPTQNKAIFQARQNTSYIIQGPPGTGKSQTITNLIADFVANGKKVLFVCEKRAAIDVVFNRLKQENLEALCCLIHDSQTDKKEFILNLKKNYELNLKHNSNVKDLATQRNEVVLYIQQEMKIIEHFTKLMQIEISSANVKSIEIYRKLIELNEFAKELQHIELDDVAGYKEWTKFGETIEQLFSKLKTHNNKDYFAEHPISMLNDILIETAPTSNELKSKLSEIAALSDEISEYLELTDFEENYKENTNDLKTLLKNIDELKLFIDTKQLALINEKSTDFVSFLKNRNELIALDKHIESIQYKNKKWKLKFSETDTENALQIAQNLETSFFRFFYSSYRSMKSSITNAYDFSQHQIKPAYSQILQQLRQEYEVIETQNNKIAEVEKQYQLGNLEAAYNQIINCQKQLHPEIKALIDENPDENKIKELLFIKTKFDRLIKLVLQVLDYRNTETFANIQHTAETILPAITDFSIYLPYLTELINASPKLKQILKTQHYSPKQLQTILAKKSMADFYVLHKEIQKIEGTVLEYHIERIKKLHQQYLKINGTYIRAKQREQFMKLVIKSELSVVGKTDEEKEEKRVLTEGRKILENEFGKSIRYKSIRELATAESGKLIRELKPVWLMSPLSISDTLPINTNYFDVVIFDEASQITVEEGIPPIFRASQTIIVGDEMQMPPSNFFSSTQNENDDVWQDENDNQTQITTDADSLLNLSARKLPSVLLGWHYRSRHESLISFSNAAFYQNQLLTIPDKMDAHQLLNEIAIKETSDAINNINHLFDRPISYHYLQNGVYENRTNEAEADYIAELLYQFYTNKKTESIGIVAFSMEQQREIEDAIDQKREQDNTFDKWLDDEYKRIEDNQYIGLFVKNLENVQGDERDIIIISTCYGYDKNKKMLMNFGPINRKGGEKRLNVIFSRAKKHVCVISSIKHTDIKNEHNDGASYLKKYLQYAELISNGNLEHAQSVLNSLTVHQIQTIDNINHLQLQICDELNKAGYFTKANIGQSHFKCHIGIKKNKEDKSYVLGIILDDDIHYGNSDLLEQYLLKPNILRNFGWNILPVFAKDWYENRTKVMQLITNKIEGRDEIDLTVGLNTEELLNKRILLTEDKQKILVGNFNSPINNTTVRLSFDDENSNKFWQISQNKNSLIVEFGKTNTNGQKIIKPYENEAEAVKEMKRLIAQKKKKGFKLV